ncbi:MAG: YitT family protein [Spirochaetes bacterium]|nr:YitT family protein [Spirochaetota bacterium]
MDRKFINFLKDLFGIIVGSALCGIGYSIFLIPFKASPGGVGGLSQFFYYIFNINPGIAMFIMNIPLFIIGVIVLGKEFGIKTLISIFFVSVFTDLFSPMNLLKINYFLPFLYKIGDKAYSFTSDYFLGVLAGSVLLGAGLGFVFKFNGSTGGTDIPALILKKYLGISPGTSFLFIDSFIIFLVGIVFKNGNLILWGFLSLFVSSKVCDIVLEGLPYNKGVMIISKKYEEIKSFIFNELDRGCTIIHGEGGFTSKELKIVYVVINLKELEKLKYFVKKMDREAFIIVNEVHDVLGYGFKKI